MQVTITYPGGTQTKNETIYYTDGQDAGFETIQTFAIATGKVTDTMVQYWLNQKNATVNGTLLYPAGYKKAAYGTFMTALTTLWLSDKLADQMAPSTNVTWARSTPTIVMTGVSSGTGYVHCPDPAMGMSVVSDVDNAKSFRFICSLLLSKIEHMTLGSTGVSVDSTLSKIISEVVLNGATFETTLDTNNNTLTLTLDGNSSYRIIIDLNTGIVKDILDSQGFSLKGATTMSTAYCYHSQLSDNQEGIDNELIHLGEGVVGGGAVSAGVLILLAGGPPEWAALALIFGVGAILESEGVPEDPHNPRKWIKAGIDIGIAAIPGGLAAKELILIGETPWMLMKSSMVYTGGKYVFKATAGGSLTEGTKKVAGDIFTSYTFDKIEDQIMDYMGVPTYI